MELKFNTKKGYSTGKEIVSKETSKTNDKFFDGFKTITFYPGSDAGVYGISTSDWIKFGISEDKKRIRIKLRNTKIPYDNMVEESVFEFDRSNYIDSRLIDVLFDEFAKTIENLSE